ncbi:hypothetical protein V6N11_011949 [Hibiscus sabdariffa]|uniref:Uncharacterized protein n=1 Tax=Hibiscus sabdariffa TaxID=183260 RepID=A0ABR2S9R7_9ROSI
MGVANDDGGAGGARRRRRSRRLFKKPNHKTKPTQQHSPKNNNGGCCEGKRRWCEQRTRENRRKPRGFGDGSQGQRLGSVKGKVGFDRGSKGS